MTLIEILKERSQMKSIGISFVDNGGQEDFLSYHELYCSALKVLAYLQGNNVSAKSELVFQIENNKSFLVVFWACILGGIIPIPLSVIKNSDHARKFVKVWKLLSKPSLIISEGEYPSLENYLAKEAGTGIDLSEVKKNTFFVEDIFSFTRPGVEYNANEGDIAFIQFSSGSTGSPKGVVLNHGNLVSNIKGISAAARYSSQDSMLSWMPLTHDMGMIGFHLNPLFSGLKQFIIPTSVFVRNPNLWLDKISEHKITITSSPNFGYRYMLKYLNSSPKNWDLSCLRIIYNGAEPIGEKLCIEFNKTISKFGLKTNAMRPVYGLAEASVAVSLSDVDDEMQFIALKRGHLSLGDRIEETTSLPESISFANVGRPVQDCAVRIANEQNVTLPENVIGLIKIKGGNVTSGYYVKGNVTRDIIDEDGWLNTGDLGFIKGGSLYITGRVKDIVFINAQNYYAHDIEKVAESVSGVELNKIAVCGHQNVESGLEEVIAFLHHRGPLELLLPVASALKEKINEHFNFEISKIIPVNHIPKTTSGKLQRFKLLTQYLSGEFTAIATKFEELSNDSHKNVTDALNDTEKRLARLFENVLQRNGINAESEFFQSGGTSLKGAEFLMQFEREFNLVMTFEQLYDLKTIRRIALAIPAFRRKIFENIAKAEIASSYQATPSQRRLYYSWQLAPFSIAYNVPVAVRLTGNLNIPLLKLSIQRLVYGHDSLRMVFHLDEEPRFRVMEAITATLVLIKCEISEWENKIKTLISPFDLSNGPLFRFFLLADPQKEEFLLLADFHHIITDAHSISLFFDKLIQLYRDDNFLKPNISFKDFAFWLKEKQVIIEKEKYAAWASTLKNAGILNLPYDFALPAFLDQTGKRLVFRFPDEFILQLESICNKFQLTNYSFLFTCYYILLYKYSRQPDITVGIPLSSRSHPDLQDVHGMFVNSLPVCQDISQNQRFIDLATEVTVKIAELMDRQDLSFDELLKLLKPASQPSASPLFNTMFLIQKEELSALQIPDLNISRYMFDPGFSKFHITLEIIEGASGLQFAIEYATALFKADTIANFAQDFIDIAGRVTANPHSTVEDLVYDQKPSKHTSINELSENKYAVSTYVHSLFEQQANRTPGKVALLCGNRKMPFGDLNSQADRVAEALHSSGYATKGPVGVHLKRSFELVTVILGILKSGATYLPLEYDMPPERVRFILSDSGCMILISQSSAADLGLPKSDVIRLITPTALISENISHHHDMHYKADVNPADAAYIIYTSGTSGRPKGVLVGHKSLANYIVWAAECYNREQKGCFPLYSSISFDLTVTSLFVPLVTGNQIVIYEEDDFAVMIEKVFRENMVNVIKLTPSHLKIIRDNHLLPLATNLKVLIVGGEAFDTQLAGSVFEQAGHEIEIFNEYGPTEATVGCMIYKYNPKDQCKTVPIGQPIINAKIYLLDTDLKQVPDKVAGEIYISGDCLAIGYWMHEGLTNEKFVQNPYKKGETMYKTGDWARRLPDGNLEYIGRLDNQLKINGNRVELGEIEFEILQSGKVVQTVVSIDEKDPNRIYAFCVAAKNDYNLNDGSLRRYLAGRLPHFMIPQIFLTLKAIPLTTNGKTDIGKLKSFIPKNISNYKVAPHNPTEVTFAKVWSEILGIKNIGITDDFFELGGDSIKAVQISARLFEQSIPVKPKDILTYHTIENILENFTSNELNSSIRNIDARQVHPAPLQSWLLRQRFVNSDLFTRSVLLDVKQHIEIEVLAVAFEYLIKNHQALRLNYLPENSESALVDNKEEDTNKIKQYSITVKQSLANICSQVKNSIDISSGSLIKMALIKKEDRSQYLFVTGHSLIMDVLSFKIFIDDLIKIYSKVKDGKKLKPLNSKPTFKYWVDWITDHSRTANLDKEHAYWIANRSAEFVIPVDYKINDSFAKHPEQVNLKFDRQNSCFLLKDAHLPYNTDVPILCNAALIRTLNEFSGFDEIVIEQLSNGRALEDAPDSSGIIGCLGILYPLKFSLEFETDRQIKSVKEVVRNVPFSGLGYEMNKFYNMSGSVAPALSELRFNYLGVLKPMRKNTYFRRKTGETGYEINPGNVFSTKLDFTAFFLNGTFHINVSYCAKMFRKSTVLKFSQKFFDNLTEILSFLKNQDQVQFTPSDFSAAGLDDESFNLLFSEN